MTDNDRRTVVVTGGSRGIGRAICVALAEPNTDIYFNYYSPSDPAAEEAAAAVDRGWNQGGRSQNGLMGLRFGQVPEACQNPRHQVQSILGPGWRAGMPGQPSQNDLHLRPAPVSRGDVPLGGLPDDDRRRLHPVGRLVVGVILVGIGLAIIVAIKMREPKPERKVVVERKIDLSGDIELEKLQCQNCGAELDKKSITLAQGAVVVSCPYCGTSYQMVEEPKW